MTQNKQNIIPFNGQHTKQTTLHLFQCIYPKNSKYNQLSLACRAGWQLNKFQHTNYSTRTTSCNEDQKRTHQSWGPSCRLLRSSCPERPGRRIRPVAEPEEEGVRSGFHYPPARGLPDHCHCSFPGNHPGGER